MKITVEMDEQEFMLFMEWRKFQAAPSVKQDQSTDDAVSIYDLNISMYSMNILTHHGVSTLGHARRMLDRELLNLPYFGRKSLNQLREAIESFDAANPKD